MGLFKKISRIFSSSSRPDDASYWVTVKCQRCGETIRTRVDLHNDLSIDYSDGGEATYFCRKLLIGESGRCFQRIEIELTFDANKKLIRHEINGGQFEDQLES